MFFLYALFVELVLDFADGKNAEKRGSPAKDLLDLRAPFCLAKKMGEGLG